MYIYICVYIYIYIYIYTYIYKYMFFLTRMCSLRGLPNATIFFFWSSVRTSCTLGAIGRMLREVEEAQAGGGGVV